MLSPLGDKDAAVKLDAAKPPLHGPTRPKPLPLVLLRKAPAALPPFLIRGAPADVARRNLDSAPLECARIGLCQGASTAGTRAVRAPPSSSCNGIFAATSGTSAGIIPLMLSRAMLLNASSSRWVPLPIPPAQSKPPIPPPMPLPLPTPPWPSPLPEPALPFILA